MLSRTTLEQQGRFDRWGDYSPLEQSTNTNTQTKTCWLNQFSALKISGPDAERFLQGQLTCDMSAITTENNLLGACCTAKGRVVANFNISFDGENYWLILPTNSADILEKHLQKYKVFFKATITNCLDSHLIFGQWIDNLKDSAQHENDVHQLSISASRRFVILKPEAAEQEFQIVATLNWSLADIKDGIYYVTDDQNEKWIPQNINWHLLEGISFSKGCYTGQEIVARLQYLGKAKKAMHHYCLDLNQEEFAENKIDHHSLTEQLNNLQLFNQSGKNLTDVLTHRFIEAESQLQLNLLVVLNAEVPDTTLYLTESADFPLTLQNLPYTVEKEV